MHSFISHVHRSLTESVNHSNGASLMCSQSLEPNQADPEGVIDLRSSYLSLSLQTSLQPRLGQ